MGKGISAGNLIAAIAVVIMALVAGGALMQTQLAHVTETQNDRDAAIKERDTMLLDRIKVLEDGARKAARDPVEKATLDAIVAAIDKRDELIQSTFSNQINDLNRQIAASLISVEAGGGNGPKKSMVMPP